MSKYRGVLVNALVTIVFVAVGWFLRGWLEAQASNWPSVRFSLQVFVPVIAAAIWFSVNHTIVKVVWARILINLGVIGGLLAWFNALVIPKTYVWSDSVPVIGGVLVGLLIGVTLLSWIKPHLADWPWWGAFSKSEPDQAD